MSHISNVAHQMKLYKTIDEEDWGRKKVKPIMSEGAWASAIFYLERKSKFDIWELRDRFKYEDYIDTPFEDFIRYVMNL